LLIGGPVFIPVFALDEVGFAEVPVSGGFVDALKEAFPLLFFSTGGGRT
jgi:hypothetical protein